MIQCLLLLYAAEDITPLEKILTLVPDIDIDAL